MPPQSYLSDARLGPGIGLGWLKYPDDLPNKKRPSWVKYAPIRAPLVVGAGIGDSPESILPDLRDVAWAGLYPLAMLLLEPDETAPRTPLPRQPYAAIMDDVEKARNYALCYFYSFLQLWKLDHRLKVPPPLIREPKGKSEYYDVSEHLFGASFFESKQQLDSTLLRWKGAKFVTKRQDIIPVSRLVESRIVDLILSELLSNSIAHGVATRGPGGFGGLLCKVIDVSSSKAALRADEAFPYLTANERVVYGYAKQHNLPLLEIVVLDNGGGFGAKEAFVEAYRSTRQREPDDLAALIAFALDGRYSSKTSQEIAQEHHSYPNIDKEAILPEVHGLGELRRVIREHHGMWRIHSQDAVIELNALRPHHFVPSQTCLALSYLVNESRLINYLGKQPIFRATDLTDFYTHFVRAADAPDSLRANISVLAEATGMTVRPAARRIHGTVHQIVLPFDDFDFTSTESVPAPRVFSVKGYRKDPDEMTYHQRPRILDLAPALQKKFRLDDFRKFIDSIVSKVNSKPGAFLLNLQVLDSMREAELNDAIALVAFGLNRMSRKSAVYLSGVSADVASRLRRVRCMASFFTERRIVPVVTAAYDRNQYDVDVIVSPALEVIKTDLRQALSLLHGNFCTFQGKSDEVVTLLNEVKMCNEAYLVADKDVAEPGIAGRVQMEGRDARALSYLFGAEPTQDFARKLETREAIKIGRNLVFRRYGRDSNYYIHLASMCADNEFVSSFHSWMLSSLLHAEGIGPFLRSQGHKLAFISILEPAIQLTRSFINKVTHFSRAEIVAVRRLTELTWDSRELMNVQAKACVVVIDVCQTYQTLNTIIATMQALECPVIATVAGLANPPRPEHGQVMAYANLELALKELQKQ